jgi:excisionase family DNA binding protein
MGVEDISSRRKSRRDEVVDACVLASVLGVHRETICRWVRRGKLRGHRLGDVRSRVRIRMKDFVAFALEWQGRGINRIIAQAIVLGPGQRQRPSAWRGRTDRRLLR